MSRLKMGDPGLAPESVAAYIEDMLMELAHMAETSGQESFGLAIRRAAETAPTARLNYAAQPGPLKDDAA